MICVEETLEVSLILIEETLGMGRFSYSTLILGSIIIRQSSIPQYQIAAFLKRIPILLVPHSASIGSCHLNYRQLAD